MHVRQKTKPFRIEADGINANLNRNQCEIHAGTAQDGSRNHAGSKQKSCTGFNQKSFRIHVEAMQDPSETIQDLLYM
jgi:hypothetical protein